MASQEQHQKQAEHNQNLLAFLETATGEEHFDDWYITVAFYTALHLFESILPVVAPKLNRGRKQGLIREHYGTHAEREGAMRMEFGNIFTPYMPLYNRSRAAKYGKYETTPIVKSLSKRHLKDVVAECRKVLDKWK